MYKVAGVPRAIASIGGGAVRFQAPHGLTAIKPNVTRMTVSGNAGVNGNMYIAGIRNANELYIAAQKSPYSGEGFGGTVTFEDSTVWPLISIAADQSGAILQVQTTCAAPASAKLYQRFRVAGSTNAQLNRDWWFSIPSTNPACNWMQNAKPMVTASGAGGTGYLITTNAYIAGVSPLMVQGVSPAAAFAGYAWAVIQGATGVRAYGLSNLDPDQDARASGFFHMEPASGDGLNYNASPKFTASGMKDRWSAMTAAAEWVAAHEAYLLQPREASPDYGSQFVTTVRSGPAGRLLVVMNTTDGYIQRAVALPGGQVTRRRMTERGAVVSAIAGAADVVTFGPNEVIAYLSVQ
jgi:hypothetical protein